MTLTQSLLMLELPQELMVLHVHKFTDTLDLISIACKLFASNSEIRHRIFGTCQ